MGWITSINLEKNQVWVDFQGNLAGRPLLAKLGRPFHFQDLKQALEQVQDIRLEFSENSENSEYSLYSPIIRDIYYSILKEKPQGGEDSVQEDLHLKARRIILEGTEQIFLKSGDVITVYDAKSGRHSTNAKEVLSVATSRNSIRGGIISLN